MEERLILALRQTVDEGCGVADLFNLITQHIQWTGSEHLGFSLCRVSWMRLESASKEPC